MRPLLLALCSSLAGGAVAATGVVMLQRWMAPAPVLVTVRLEELLAAQVQSLSASLGDPAQQALAAERYARALDAELDRTAQEYGAVVFAGGAVIRGATDLTGTVRARLDARLAAGAPP